jgi:hypothetical protein
MRKHYILCSVENLLNEIKKEFHQFIMRKYILSACITSIENLLNEIKKAFRSSLILEFRKYSGSHRKLRPAGAEYEINDGLLRNMAAHSGFPYLWLINRFRPVFLLSFFFQC